ncbi:PLP-dependent aminotransferase family protein [Paenibacillus sp. BC26]|uniref:aminotransferase-like domain-containing protein n=1 Tax=Paenibacillus sp. BC26 TaxID=1881032 RepID=UPI0008E637E2|nr:PLP-dependent aminotransferase family protein [Paenibacillus sp. BC26]SFS68423.1 transcriptional regulator, GntR family [Paenibacillus sp. BC26]
MEMNIPLDRKSRVPLAEQIQLALVERIRSGLYQAGDLLPSVRELSREIGVSLMTAVLAYEKLEATGYAQRHHGKGTFVSIPRPEKDEILEGIHPKPSYDWQLAIPDYLGRSMFRHVGAVNRKDVKYPLHRIKLHAEELLPLQHFQRAVQQASSDRSSIGDYAPAAGDEALRSKLASTFRHKSSVLTASELLITTGTQQAIDLIARTFLGPGDLVAVESPTYPGALDAFRSRGATLISIPTDHTGMRLDILQQLCDIHPPKLIYTLPTGQNPTGSVMSVQKRLTLLEIAKSYNTLIVEDDPWEELYFEDLPPRSLFSLDQTGHVIYMQGYSKSIAPGLRLSVIAARGSVYQRLLHAKAVTDLSTPLFNQRILLHLLEQNMNEHFRKVRGQLTKRRDEIHQLLKRHAPSAWTWTPPAAGPFFWLTSTGSVNTDALFVEAERQGVLFFPGSFFYSGNAERNSLRIGFAALAEARIREAILTLCQLLHHTELK